MGAGAEVGVTYDFTDEFPHMQPRAGEMQCVFAAIQDTVFGSVSAAAAGNDICYSPRDVAEIGGGVA